MFMFSLIVSHNFFRVGGFTRVEKNSWMIVSVELWIVASAPTCQPLRLTWDVITYRFARSIVTNVHKIFKYIYHFSFHVSSDVQTDRLFGVVTTLGNNDYEDRRWGKMIVWISITCAWATRGRRGTTREGSNITLRTTPKANIACYREYNLL